MSSFFRSLSQTTIRSALSLMPLWGKPQAQHALQAAQRPCLMAAFSSALLLPGLRWVSTVFCQNGCHFWGGRQSAAVGYRREECTAISWPTMETQRLLNLFNVSAFYMAPLSPRPARLLSLCGKLSKDKQDNSVNFRSGN